jgi:hypothetical protein
MAEKSIKITGLSAVTAQLKSISDFLQSPAPMQHIVDEVKEMVLDKTARGLDYRGRVFAPYSKEYAKKKGKTRPDLKASGRMLGAVTAKVDTPQHGTVSIRDAKGAEIGTYHNEGTKKMPQREFMNITQAAVDKLAKKHMDDEIRKLLGRK